jgi:hypothetical protein
MRFLISSLVVITCAIFATSASAFDVRKLQGELRDLGYPVTVDGVMGRGTMRALTDFFTENSYEFGGEITDRVLSDFANIREDLQQPIPWIFHDEFDSINWRRYDESHAPRSLARIGHIRLEEETNGNSYISLTSVIGQLENFNRGQDRYIKDRVELGLPPRLAEFDLDDRILWYGFRVRSPEGRFVPNAHSVTFNQFKQIQKDAGRNRDCFPGMFWRMNAQSDGTTWMAVTDENGNNINKTTISTFIDSDWSTVRVGVYFTESNRGWLRAYVNGRQVYTYSGRTIMNQFTSCRPAHFESYLRIGVYRGSDTRRLGNRQIDENQSDTLHFDTFIVSDNSRDVEVALAQ